MKDYKKQLIDKSKEFYQNEGISDKLKLIKHIEFLEKYLCLIKYQCYFLKLFIDKCPLNIYLNYLKIKKIVKRALKYYNKELKKME